MGKRSFETAFSEQRARVMKKKIGVEAGPTKKRLRAFPFSGGKAVSERGVFNREVSNLKVSNPTKLNEEALNEEL